MSTSTVAAPVVAPWLADTLALMRPDLERWGHDAEGVATYVAEAVEILADGGPIESWHYWAGGSRGWSAWHGETSAGTCAVRFVCSYRGEADYEVSLRGQSLGRVLVRFFDVEHEREDRRRLCRVESHAAGWYDWSTGLRLDACVLEILRRIDVTPEWVR